MRQKFRFTKDFDFVITSPRREVAYKAGTEAVIPKEHAEAAIAARAGAYVDEPSTARKKAKAED